MPRLQKDVEVLSMYGKDARTCDGCGNLHDDDGKNHVPLKITTFSEAKAVVLWQGTCEEAGFFRFCGIDCLIMFIRRLKKKAGGGL